MGGKSGMKMTVILTGPMWIVKGAPGTAEYLNFYKGAVEKGWIFSDPRGAKGNPGQAKAMAEMYRQLAATGGIPYEQEMNVKMGGDGPMAAMLAKMGNISMTRRCSRLKPARWPRTCSRCRPATRSRSRSSLRLSRRSPVSSYLSLLGASLPVSWPSSSVPRGRSSKRPRAWTRGSTPTTRSDR